MQLKQLVPQDFCLRCDVCCRFPQLDSVWAPLFTQSEINSLVEHDILPPLVFTRHPKGQGAEKTEPLKINLIEHKDCFICPCLSASDHRCKIYKDRPFECRLYPFLLVKIKGKFYLAKDGKCPYFKQGRQDEINEYIEYLRKEIQKSEMRSFLRQNQALFIDYPPEDLEILFPINL